jgi:hypothetical protein
MSRVAAGHFRRKREAPLILRGCTSQFRGHPGPEPCPGLLHLSPYADRPYLLSLDYQLGNQTDRGLWTPLCRRLHRPAVAVSDPS